MKTFSLHWVSGNCLEFNEAFIRGLKPLMFVGRVLGLLPRSDVLLLNKHNGTERRLHFLYSTTLTVFFFVNAVFQTISNIQTFKAASTVYEKLHELVLPMYTITMFLIYSYFLLNSKKLRAMVSTLLSLGKTKSFSLQSFSTFPRFCFFALVFIMGYGIAENIAFDVQSVERAEKFTNSTLHRYYLQNLNHWRMFIPYQPVLTLLLVVLIKCGTYAWVFVDILVVVLCRAVAERLKILKAHVEQTVNPSSSDLDNLPRPTSKHASEMEKKIKFSLEDSRLHYLLITDLVRELEAYISPLILACYGINVYLIIVNLFCWISPNESVSFEQTFYNYFAFANFSFRVSSVTYFVADMFHESNTILTTLQKCPNRSYTLPVERLERSILWNPCGVTLFGTFMITKRFFISIVSFIFTVEIVLLQTVRK